MRKKKYWFAGRSPRLGYRLGWGLPLSWQGWAVYAAILVLVGPGSHYVAHYGNIALISYLIVVVIFLIIIISTKAEPL